MTVIRHEYESFADRMLDRIADSLEGIDESLRRIADNTHPQGDPRGPHWVSPDKEIKQAGSLLREFPGGQ